MTTLAAKFEMLISGGVLQASPGDSTGPTPYYFEVGASLGSPWITGDSGNSCRFIGAESYVNSGGYLRDQVLIGRFCSIGRRVTIGAGAHSMAGLSTSPQLRGSRARSYDPAERSALHPQRKRAPVTVIHSDVWIGDGAVIMPGITLDVGCVVGANAVVTQDVPPYAIVAGVPARAVGARFSPDVATRLLQSAWWEAPVIKLNDLPCANVFEFLDAMAAQGLEDVGYPTFRAQSA